MDVNDFFNIVLEPTKGMYKDKGSSFLSFIYPILQESTVKSILLQVRKEHPKARHICHAYQWGPDPTYHRINDDGEPGGTAGSPILNQLKSYKLENTLLVVVRYFGGTLLGVPGLIQAYKQSALDVIQHSTIIQMRRSVYFNFTGSYTMEKNIVSFLKKYSGEVMNKNYRDTVALEVSFPLSLHYTILSELPHLIAGINHQSHRDSLQQRPDPITSTFLKKDDF